MGYKSLSKKHRKYTTKNKQRKHNKSKKYKKSIYKGGVILLNVSQIKFTQNSVSHSFTDKHSGETITSQYDKIHRLINKAIEEGRLTMGDTFDTEFLIKYSKNKIGEKLFKLNVIERNGEYYSCNNRRLCLLKRIVNLGFDGNIICEVESGCQHEIILSPNVLIQKGISRGENCLEGIEPAKERTEERDRYNLGVSDYMSDNFVVSDTSSSKESKPKEPKQSRFKPRFKPNHSYPPPTPLDTFDF